MMIRVLTGDTWRLGRRAELDGVRGIAIVLVLVGHGWLPGMPSAGKIGVGVFFTLSGFLITSLLLEERAANGRVDFRRFYTRRALRLLPAQIVATTTLVLVGMSLGAVYMRPSTAAAAYLYLSNFLPYDGLTGHFWSLAIEEQFYLVWAPVLAWLLARTPRPTTLRVVLIGAVISLVLRLSLPQVLAGVRIEAALPLQADGLLIGCALALARHGTPETIARPRVVLLSLGGLVTLAFLPMRSAQSWGVSLAGILAALTIWAAAQGIGVPALRWRPLLWLGRRSYALYLWHFPIGFLLEVGFGVTTWLTYVAAVAPLSLLMTVASWRYVEAPFLRLKSRQPPPRKAVHLTVRELRCESIVVSSQVPSSRTIPAREALE